MTTASLTERNLAMATHVATLATLLIGGWGLHLVVPLFVMLWQRTESPYVAEHAREELNFQLSLTLYLVIAFVLTVVTFGIAVLILIPIAIIIVIVALVVMIRASLAASRGERYRYPLTIRLVS